MKITTVIAAVLVPLLVLAALESQWIGYAAYSLVGSAKAAGSESEGPPQQTISDAMSRDGGNLTLLAVGDIANCPERPGFASAFPVAADLLGLPSAFEPSRAPAVATVRLARRWPDAPILALGDLVYSSGKPVEFSDCFDPLWKADRGRTLPTPGNHEYKTPDAFGYYQYWGERAGPGSRGYYAVHAGNWLILSLNSEVDASPGSAQALWLNKALAASPEACVLAFYHQPAHSLQHRSGNGNAIALFEQLQRAGTTLVLNGHNHIYERTLPLGTDGAPDPEHGTMAFTVGTGDEKSPEMPTLDTTAAAIFGHLGLLRLELGKGEFRWWFEDAESGSALDEGVGRCNARAA
ncbi:metallophosphoesterase [Salipiger sp. H15]|uniref:Metallophosphoesterase n=1 Tax=Alloyangia sp. H15 TaxID=3029062 RepID=A0AAU8ADM4_9RHOB